jgi:hypothetical protein
VHEQTRVTATALLLTVQTSARLLQCAKLQFDREIIIIIIIIIITAVCEVAN